MMVSGKPVSIFAIAVLAFLTTSTVTFTADADALYQKGKQAFDSENYVTALKELYAYLQVAESVLSSNPGFKTQLLEVISYSEKEVRLAVKTKKYLDEFGEIREVVVSASGAADDPTGRTRNVSFNPPQDSWRSRPGFPSSPPKARVDTARIIGVASSPVAGGTQTQPHAVRPDASSEDSAGDVQCEGRLEELERRFRSSIERCRQALAECRKPDTP